ncbi:hypothetical protein E2562_001928 [Oryza meyeriana var. granulata]|uniref:Uncharacterized protein n=1 Tax=Oryza meyeriana var. granulata TaxID=110450 RepID=A0A6G1C385_9ORYZ|nr:hypothetical protein E2562_001928 [Oryza meyeriana var. granulata]
MVPAQAFLDLLQAADDTSGSGDAAAPNSIVLTTQQLEAPDVEEGSNDQTATPQPAAAAPLLEGVTVDGDTALHVLATSGDGDGFLRSAQLIYCNAKHLLVAQNSKGDTPLHCAVRAGRPRMVSRLLDLARAEANGGELCKKIARKENGRKETALHEAVRHGSSHTVQLLMEADSELASFPKQGTSPLYLAILLERIDIAHSLYAMSGGNLSYAGPNGQNALHAAVLRGQEPQILDKWRIKVLWS